MNPPSSRQIASEGMASQKRIIWRTEHVHGCIAVLLSAADGVIGRTRIASSSTSSQESFQDNEVQHRHDDHSHRVPPHYRQSRALRWTNIVKIFMHCLQVAFVKIHLHWHISVTPQIQNYVALKQHLLSE
jgi:hypothetical protein